MSTAIVKQSLTPEIWATIEKIAPTMQKSRLFGVATVEQAAAIMLKGYELGMGLTASFEFIHIITDKPSLSPRGALALIIQSGESESLKIEDQTDDKGNPTACQVTMKRRNGVEYTTRYTMENAKIAGLIKPDSGWSKYPANMLRWRAVGYAADVVYPDVIGGMKRADELGAAISPDGDVIDASWNVVSQPTSTPAKTETPAAALNRIVAQYGPELVLEVTGGVLPSVTTIDEVEALATKLEAARRDEINSVTLEALPEDSPA